MEDYSSFIWGSFCLTSFLCFVLFQVDKQKKQSGGSQDESVFTKNFLSFRNNYLVVYLLAMFSDWLQGPYVYQLYVSYGFTQQEIAELFVCGFGSSMVMGTFVGSFSDKFGRKIMCLVYCITYIVACITKLFNHYWILMIGRFLSGIATSLLFSSFESWMVCEHGKKGFQGNLIGNIFSLATFGNGLIAVVAGLLANSAAASFGYVAPFVIALIPLSLCGFVINYTWSENYGNQQQSIWSSMVTGFTLIQSDPRIAALGLSQSCFEGAMYTFVFMWTPALTNSDNNISEYLGLIFAVFMVSVMLGSSGFTLMGGDKEKVLMIPIYLHSVALLSMLCVTFFLVSNYIIHNITISSFYRQ